MLGREVAECGGEQGGECGEEGGVRYDSIAYEYGDQGDDKHDSYQQRE